MTFIKKLKENWKDVLIISLNVLIFLFLGYIFFASTFTIQNSNSFNSRSSMGVANSIAMPSYSSKGIVGNSYSTAGNTIKSMTANINLETYYYNRSKNEIMSLIKENKGYILNENEYTNNENYKTLNLNIKVPSSNLNTFIKSLKSCCKVTSLSINTLDRTKTYNDYQERITRYETQVKKYKVMLQKNITVDEEVKIQNRIDTLENEIAYLQNTLNNINESSKYSKVYLSLYQKKPFFATVDFITLKGSIKGLLEALNAGIIILIYVFGFIIPFLIIFGIYKLIKKSKHITKERSKVKKEN